MAEIYGYISNKNGATWVHANYFSGLPSTQKKSPGCRAKTRVAVAGPMDSVVRSCPSWELRHGAESATIAWVAERRRPGH